MSNLELSLEPEGIAGKVRRPASSGRPSRADRKHLGALVVIDAASAAAGWALVALTTGGLGDTRIGAFHLVVFAGVVTPMVHRKLHLYDPCEGIMGTDKFGAIAKGSATTAVLLLAAAGLLGAPVLPELAPLSALGAFGTLTAARGGFALTLRWRFARHTLANPVVIVGANAEGYEIWRVLEENPESGFRVVGVVGRQSEYARFGVWADYLGTPDDLGSAATAATCAFVAPTALSPADLKVVCRNLAELGLTVHLSGGLRGVHQRRLQVRRVGNEGFVRLSPGSFTPAQMRMKRAFDLLVAPLLLLAVLPVLGIAMLAIVLTDGRPVLFRQQRVGRDGRLFTMYKLRTMVRDAEARLDALTDFNERGGPLFKLKDDPRVTRVGKFLRDSSIDELAQLFNVLNGSMSLVGPRPALLSETKKFDRDLLSRHRIWPGMTGLWQVSARDSESFESYRRLDLFYVENWSLGQDLAILARTIPAVAGRGLRHLRAVGAGRRTHSGTAEGSGLRTTGAKVQ